MCTLYNFESKEKTLSAVLSRLRLLFCNSLGKRSGDTDRPQLAAAGRSCCSQPVQCEGSTHVHPMQFRASFKNPLSCTFQGTFVILGAPVANTAGPTYQPQRAAAVVANRFYVTAALMRILCNSESLLKNPLSCTFLGFDGISAIFQGIAAGLHISRS